MDVRGEAGDHDPTLRPREHLLEVRSDHPLRRGEAGTVRVGGVAAEQQHAFAAELGEPLHVGRLAVNRSLVELVVAGQQHNAQLGADGDRTRIGNRMGHVDQLHVERPRFDRVAGVDLLELHVFEPVLVELGAGHRDRQPAAVDRRRPTGGAELAQHPGQRAEMILVAVRDHDRLDVVCPLAQVAEIRQHQVDAEHLGGREAQPGVDHDDPPVVLHDGHVLADLAQPAEREDAKCSAHARAA